MKMVDRRRTDGRTSEQGYTISSHCEPAAKTRFKLAFLRRQAAKTVARTCWTGVTKFPEIGTEITIQNT